MKGRHLDLASARAAVERRREKRRQRERVLKSRGMVPKRLVKARGLRAKLMHAKSLRESVIGRDGQQCQCCHITVFVDASHPIQRAQVHHIRFRSQGGKDESKNLITLCAGCHDQVHRHTITVVGTNANKDVRFVRRVEERING